jgi:hypothetical protein
MDGTENEEEERTTSIVAGLGHERVLPDVVSRKQGLSNQPVSTKGCMCPTRTSLRYNR